MAVAELPVAEQVRPLDLISYQEGAVVSRTLLKRSTGTITLFAFDQGQGLSEHTAPVGLELPILALNPGLRNVARRQTSDLR